MWSSKPIEVTMTKSTNSCLSALGSRSVHTALSQIWLKHGDAVLWDGNGGVLMVFSTQYGFGCVCKLKWCSAQFDKLSNLLVKKLFRGILCLRSNHRRDNSLTILRIMEQYFGVTCPWQTLPFNIANTFFKKTFPSRLWNVYFTITWHVYCLLIPTEDVFSVACPNFVLVGIIAGVGAGASGAAGHHVEARLCQLVKCLL